MQRLLIVLLVWLMAGCTSNSKPEERREHADRLDVGRQQKSPPG